MQEQIPHYSEILKNLLTAAAFVFGGFFTYYKFILHGERRPMPTCDVDLRVIADVNNSWIVELSCLFENKGMVRHKIPVESFFYTLKFLKSGEELKNGFEKKGVTHNTLTFPHEFTVNGLSKILWLPAKWEHTFIEPGTSQRYTATVAIPKEYQVALFHTRFSYKKSPKEFHTAERCFKMDGPAKTS